jgi:small subunit ribosomal protein S8
MTDPISDLLARIKNGILARKASIDVPTSKMKKRLAEILRDEGFVGAVVESGPQGEQKHGVITIQLRWDQNKPAISGIRRVSKPGQRAYVHRDKLPKVRGGLGTAVISTSRGMMTDREARKVGLGGEVVCEVW